MAAELERLVAADRALLERVLRPDPGSVAASKVALVSQVVWYYVRMFGRDDGGEEVGSAEGGGEEGGGEEGGPQEGDPRYH